MNAIQMVTCRRLWVFLTCALLSVGGIAAPIGYQKEREIDFFERYPFGSIGFFPAGETRESARSVFVVPGGTSYRTNRRVLCHGIVHNWNPESNGMHTFVGIQIIKVFRDHPTPNVVYVSRNGGANRSAPWMPRIEDAANTNKLPPQQLPSNTEIIGARLADFARAHSSQFDDAIAKLKLTYTKNGSVAALWHARVGRTANERIDTADIDHRKFWAVDSLKEQFFVENVQPFGKHVVRTENLLISYQVTSLKSWTVGPDFKFECSDSMLLGVYLRIFVPSKQDSQSWHEIKFE